MSECDENEEETVEAESIRQEPSEDMKMQNEEKNELFANLLKPISQEILFTRKEPTAQS